jgi:hypothetical protein
LRLHEARADFAFRKAAYDGQIKHIEGHEKVIAEANKEIAGARENAEKWAPLVAEATRKLGKAQPNPPAHARGMQPSYSARIPCAHPRKGSARPVVLEREPEHPAAPPSSPGYRQARSLLLPVPPPLSLGLFIAV